jgi:YidC/Oxa1 family membrane protein insertase
MDRNTIIGFIIIMAVLLLFFPVWNHFFPPAPLKTPPTSTQAPESTQTRSQAPAESLKALSPGGQIAEAESTGQAVQQIEPEKLVNIETQHLKISLSSYGGNIKQVVLKNYPRHDGKSYAMLGEYSTPDWARYGALTLGDEERILPFNGASFQVSDSNITLTPQDSISSVKFTYSTINGASITKTFIFHYSDYIYNLKIDITKPADLGFRQGITVGWFEPLEPSERDINLDRAKLGGYFDMAGDFLNYKGLKNGTLRQAATGPIDWVATKTKYFAAVIIADSSTAGQTIVVGAESNKVDSLGRITKWDQYGIGMTYEHPEQDTSLSFTIYTGPLDYDKLRDMGRGLSNLVDFGWHLLRPFAIAIFWLFTTIHKAVPNYGFVLIVFAVIMQAIFWPLSLKTIKATYKMREIQPVLTEIKEKYKNDAAKLNQETMKAYKEYGVNPFGSCLPMLIQLPVFWALYAVLSNTIALRGAPFIFWIHDLSQPDPTGRLLFGIGILPILMGVTMFVQQKMTITDPKQQMMVYLMPLLFTYLFSRWASGLVLYWTTVSILGIFQQWYAKRFVNTEKLSKRT